jgi:hypothetical protein
MSKIEILREKRKADKEAAIKKLMDKKLSDLTESEVVAIHNYCKKVKFSKNGETMNRLNGYICFFQGKPICKWEAIVSGLSFDELYVGKKRYSILKVDL